MSGRPYPPGSRWRARLGEIAHHRLFRWLVLSGLTLTLVWLLPWTSDLVGWGFLAAIPFLLFTGVWGLRHLRVLSGTTATVLRWSLGAAATTTVAVLVAGPAEARRAMGMEVSANALFILGASVLLTALLLATLVSLTLAGMGGWIGRRREDPSPAACAAVRAWWSALAAAAIACGVAGVVPPDRVAGAAILCLLALGGLAASRTGPQGPGWGMHGLALLRSFAHRLVWVRRGRRLDLRGVALGALGAALTLLVANGPVKLLQPLQAGTLESLLNLRNQPDLVSRSGYRQAFAEPTPGVDWRRRIVIIEMDPVARREALTEASEAQLITRALKRLRSHRPQRVVVPVPQLDAIWPHDRLERADAPPSGKEAAARNRRDLPLLIEALRASPAAVLAVPRLTPTDLMRISARGDSMATLSGEAQAAMERLTTAAPAVGDAALDWFGTTRIPAIRVDAAPAAGTVAARPQPTPILLFAAARSMPGARAVSLRDGVRLAGIRVPVTAEGGVFVDYGGADPAPFPRVAYTAVLSGERIFDPTPSGAAPEASPVGWRTAGEFFNNKIVLLQPLSETSADTPVGRLGSTELLGEATATLLTGRFVRAVSPGTGALALLLLCVIVGQSCVGRAPLMSGLRTAFAGLFVLLLAPVMIFSGVWMDPVAPLAGLVITYGLVTQITFNLEQDERRRQRFLLDRVASPQVVEELLDRTERLSLGGERREVCILFADVRGFTPFAESHTAEQVVEVINRYTTAMTEALLAHHGILDRYTGDGLVARFDVVRSPEDVTQAVAAAVAIRDAAEALAKEMLAKGEPDLRIGLGLHFGEAVVGLVGSPTQFHYTAMGHSVVVAARLQTSADGGEVLITDAVYNLVKDAFRCEAQEPMWLKGISEPVLTYRVLGRAPLVN